MAALVASTLAAIQVVVLNDPEGDLPGYEAHEYPDAVIDVPALPNDGGVWQPGSDAWPAPGRVTLAVGAAGMAGDLPVSITGTGAGSVAVELLGKDVSQTLGASGPAVLVEPETAGDFGASLTYDAFRNLYGGDWQRRLSLTRFPACAASTPSVDTCRIGERVESDNDLRAGAISAGAAEPMVLAITAEESSETGDYKATDLQASGSWTAGDGSGGFSYSIPVKLPPAEGPVPELALSYSSQSVDGRMAGANNQASWAGDGWDIPLNFIERSYVSCADDKKAVDGKDPNNKDKDSGDQCWSGESENITVSLNGSNGSLIQDDDGTGWHLQADANWKVQLLGSPATTDASTTERWVVTTPDGTRFFFASDVADASSRWTVPVFGNHPGEDCHVTEFKDSSCKQAYRWLLDKAIDINGNTVTFDYATETGYYGAAADKDTRVSYIRGGRLQSISYGLHSSEPDTKATAKVVFDTADRCLVDDCWTDGKAVTKNWPDVPWDSYCWEEPCTEELSPVFFNSKRLTKIRTQIFNGTSYDDVESWAFTHEFKAATRESSASLWLKQLQHTGYIGTDVIEPPIVFTGIELANNANTAPGAPLFSRWRIDTIRTEAGADIHVSYSAMDCGYGNLPAKVEDNSKRCYPVYWTPEGAPDPVRDWFHKYVVTEVTEIDHTGGQPTVSTKYDYSTVDGGDKNTGTLWGYDTSEFTKKKHRTYGIWRGYALATTTVGDATYAPPLTTQKRFYRGFDGEKLPDSTRRDVWVTDSEGVKHEDHEALSGMMLEESVLNGAVIEQSTVTDYWTHETASRTHAGGTDRAYFAGPEVAKSRSWLATDSVTGTKTWARTESATTYDNATGLPVTVSELGDVSKAGDETCSTTTYVSNDTKWLRGLTARVETVGKKCKDPVTRPADLISDELTFYDGATSYTATPSKGMATRTDTLDKWENGAAVYATGEQKTYDKLGRVLTTTDAYGSTTTTAYTPVGAGPVTETLVTNVLGHVTRTLQNPAWAEPTAIIDANSKRTDLEQDALGRLTKVWLPGRAKATQTPNLEFSYLIRNDGPLAVTSKRLGPNGKYITEIGLFDSLYRSVQTQEDTIAGERLVTTTAYDDRGQAIVESGPNHATGVPSTEPVLITPGADRTRLEKTYDALGRIGTETTYDGNEVLFTGGTVYGGNTTGWQVLTSPPQGGTIQATVSDVHDNVTEIRQYTDQTLTDHVSTSYEYDVAGNLTTVTDAMGREWLYEYDLRGRSTKVDDPDKGVATTRYNNAGDVTWSKDANDNIVETVYDELGRQKERYFAKDVNGVETGRTLVAKTMYDTVAKGHLAESSTYLNGDPAKAFTHKVTRYSDAYDVLDETSIIPSVPGLEALSGSYRVMRSFSVDGSLKSTFYGALGGLKAENVVVGYDDLGNGLTVTGNDSDGVKSRKYVSTAAYTPYGELQSRTLGPATGNRVWEGRQYEAATRRLAKFEIARTGTVTNIASVRYTYDQAGNVRSVANAPTDNDGAVRPGTSDVQCFDYDFLRRLNQAWAQGEGTCGDPSLTALGGPAKYWKTYAHDDSGSRAQTVDKHLNRTTDYEYDNFDPANPNAAHQSHAVTRVVTGSAVDHYDWDDTGNLSYRMVADRAENLTWTPHGKLASIISDEGTTKMVYDADGNRIARIDANGDASLFVAGQEVTFTKATSKLTGTRYYEHNGDIVASRTMSTGATIDDTIWQGADHNGTASWQINGTTMVESIRYTDPYGAIRGTTGGTWGGGQRGFVGGIDDPGGFTLLGARFYDENLGAFISVDPKTDQYDPQRMHPYAYANNNPVTFSDPEGLFWGAIAKAASSVGNAVASAAQTVVDNAGTIAAVAGVVATVATFLPPPAQIVAAAAGAVAAVAGAIDTAKSCIGGDAAGCAMGVASMIPGVRTVVDAYDTVTGAVDAVSACTGGDVMSCGTGVLGMLPGGKGKNGPGSGKDPDKPGGCNSFVPGTEVLMADGTRKPIEEVEPDDQVLATEPETGRTGARPVTALITGEGTKELVEISVDTNGDGESDAAVIATGGHPIWAENVRSWVTADHLQFGDQIQTSTGVPGFVTQTLSYKTEAAVYNLSVADIHTYYVDFKGTGVLVHNTNENEDCGYDLNGKDPMSIVPDDASMRPLTPDPNGGAQYGVEYKWTNEKGTSRLRIHGPDGKAPEGSNARTNITYRVQIGSRYQDINGRLYHRQVHNNKSPNYNPKAANATHITWMRKYKLPLMF
ncbi:polymorphic toxin type 30 domain-containing protein [Phytomonospora sp. NPDC050363]|uniref:polymorphic toxin type 30 domain-containing protein n=1 Tax=Phytomonospora sp. NPDC050363 TaxID=3155642 RepID=UPI0033C37639